jgi:hypothetical protein
MREKQSHGGGQFSLRAVAVFAAVLAVPFAIFRASLVVSSPDTSLLLFAVSIHVLVGTCGARSAHFVAAKYSRASRFR